MDDPRRDLSKNLGEAAYAAVGFAVLGIQRAQVRRRELLGLLGREAERVSSWLRAPPAPNAGSPEEPPAGGGS